MRLPPLRLHLDDLTRRLRRARRLDVATDFDGTLSPIVEHPWRARIDPRGRAALARLARTPHARVAVVSGRLLAELRRLVPVRGIALAGNSGLEPSRAVAAPHAGPPASLPPGLEAELARWASRFARARVERKGAVLAVHFGRLAPASRRSFLAGIERRLASPRTRVKLTRGARSWDVAPPGSPDKGTVVRRWHGASGPGTLLVYLGDDTNDLPAFAYARRAGGVAVAVGRALAGAQYQLADPRESAAFLEWLAQVWPACRAAKRS